MGTPKRTIELAPGGEAAEERRDALAAPILLQLLRLKSEFANDVPVEYRLVLVALSPPATRSMFRFGTECTI